jgi:GDP-L-fucose synthase
MKTHIAGHTGMVGSALMRQAHLLGIPTLTADRKELNLLNQQAVFDFLSTNQPDQVIIAAAKVGGIHANATYPADFLYENLVITTNLIEGARMACIPRLLFLGSSCIYPREASQPIREDALLTAPLETTNEAYALAKIAGVKMCQYYRKQYGLTYHSVMPCNLYGPGDNYHPENSHVIPALIRRFHEAKMNNLPSVEIWGTGLPRREFLHVDDLARACFLLLGHSNPPDWVNVGYGSDFPIWLVAQFVAEVVGYTGLTIPDPSKPNGTYRKLLSNSLIHKLGWKAEIALMDGLQSAYQDFLTTYKP